MEPHDTDQSDRRCQAKMNWNRHRKICKPQSKIQSHDRIHGHKRKRPCVNRTRKQRITQQTYSQEPAPRHKQTKDWDCKQPKPGCCLGKTIDWRPTSAAITWDARKTIQNQARLQKLKSQYIGLMKIASSVTMARNRSPPSLNLGRVEHSRFPCQLSPLLRPRKSGTLNKSYHTISPQNASIFGNELPVIV